MCRCMMLMTAGRRAGALHCSTLVWGECKAEDRRSNTKRGVELGANFCRLEERRQNMTSYSLTALLTPRKPTDDPRLDGSWRRAGRCGWMAQVELTVFVRVCEVWTTTT